MEGFSVMKDFLEARSQSFNQPDFRMNLNHETASLSTAPPPSDKQVSLLMPLYFAKREFNLETKISAQRT
jgi:hypothetical protein